MIPEQPTLSLNDVHAIQVIAVFDLNTYLMDEPPLSTDMTRVYESFKNFEVPKTTLKEMRKLVDGDHSLAVCTEVIKYLQYLTSSGFDQQPQVEAVEFRWSTVGDLMRGQGKNYSLLCATDAIMPVTPEYGRFFAFFARANKVDARIKPIKFPEHPTLVNVSTLFKAEQLEKDFYPMLTRRKRFSSQTTSI